jgi:hypothetical protein
MPDGSDEPLRQFPGEILLLRLPDAQDPSLAQVGAEVNSRATPPTNTLTIDVAGWLRSTLPL